MSKPVTGRWYGWVRLEPAVCAPLNQPHATLVSLGIQTVVTSNHRIEPGTRIAVKANKTTPQLDAPGWIVYEQFDGRTSTYWLEHYSGKQPMKVPLGMVVCTAVVTDCLPIARTTDPPSSWHGLPKVVLYSEAYSGGPSWLELDETGMVNGKCRDLSDQLPYCDWTPTVVKPVRRPDGYVARTVQRWAWLLADIEHDIECPVCEGRGLLAVRSLEPTIEDSFESCLRCGGSGRVALPLDPKEIA